ncbi:MAG: Flp pilus assembly protein CpaB [Actinomycetota bacterium]|nr:Flp pilus assembly protein CpaB [Actinomycetota bacterium]
MKNRATLIIKQKILAILFLSAAAAIGIFMFWYINNLRSKIPQNENLQKVVIAGRDIAAGQIIQDSMVQVQGIPSAISSERAIRDPEKVVGEECLKDISRGEIIYSEFISGQSPGSSSGYSSYIPQGKRLVTVPVTFYGPFELLQPGQNIDMVSVYYQQASGDMVPQTVISRKEIVMVSRGQDNPGQNQEWFIEDSQVPEPSGSTGCVVSIYVTGQEAETVFLALERGTINLSLCPAEIFNY